MSDKINIHDFIREQGSGYIPYLATISRLVVSTLRASLARTKKGSGMSYNMRSKIVDAINKIHLKNYTVDSFEWTGKP